MNIGDPFVRHTTYCFEVLQGYMQGEFNAQGSWPSKEPAVVSEGLQERTIDDLTRWKDLVKKYAAVTKMIDPREMFILAMAIQRFPGPVLEIGTYRGVTTCLMTEAMNTLKRSDLIYTVELFQEGYKGTLGDDEYPGEAYLKALKQFRGQKALQRVVPILGDSHALHPMFWGLRPTVIFMDGDHSEEGMEMDLQMLSTLQYHWVCLIHDASVPSVLNPVLRAREKYGFTFANFHTGTGSEKGLTALSRL
ncbi:MAG: class I SAM-dependent methyltransferase [Sumerlaeia bacterium]